MIGYGMAFGIGFIVGILGRALGGKAVYPWSVAPIAWGVVFVVLNWVATFG